MTTAQQIKIRHLTSGLDPKAITVEDAGRGFLFLTIKHTETAATTYGITPRGRADRIGS